MALVKAFPLRQISSDAEYDRAAEVLDGLVLRELTKGERDYLDALTLIVAAYDDEHHPPPGLERRTPLQRLKWLMESAGMTPSQLGDVIQSRPAASMFLNGTRKELSKPQIRRLARHFNLDPGFFF
jgi:HTH-type transcriptional regulator/antitoxin HigA